MKRIAVIICVFLASGCSTHPVADLMDFFFPARLPQGPGRGGVQDTSVVGPAFPPANTDPLLQSPPTFDPPPPPPPR